MGFGTGQLAWFEVCFVNHFWAVLEVKAQVIVVEIGIIVFDDFLDVLNLQESTEGARRNEVKIWIVDAIHACEGVAGHVDDADGN